MHMTRNETPQNEASTYRELAQMSHILVSIAHFGQEPQYSASQPPKYAQIGQIGLKKRNFCCLSGVIYTMREMSRGASGAKKKLPERQFCGTLMVGLYPRRWPGHIAGRQGWVRGRILKEGRSCALGIEAGVIGEP